MQKDIPASYQLRPQKPREIEGTNILKMTLVLAGVIGAFGIGLVSLLHGDNLSSSQATQIRLLDQANTRLANQLSAESTQLSQMSAKLAAADPAYDTNLITCRDLQNMNLMATGGASIVTGGGISLNQSAVLLPHHCRK